MDHLTATEDAEAFSPALLLLCASFRASAYGCSDSSGTKYLTTAREKGEASNTHGNKVAACFR